MNLSKLIWIFFKLLLEFVKIYIWISLLCLDLSKKNKLRFDKDFRACWSFWLEFMVLKYSMHWVCSAFDKVLSSSWGSHDVRKVQFFNIVQTGGGSCPCSKILM